MNKKIKLKFWGVRGSVPCPGAETVRYGGNTACLEIRFPELDDRLLIIDAGSGLRSLGNQMMAKDFVQGPIDASIFLTHTHWDHIMGFPFFVPIYVPGNKLTIYGPVSYEEDTLQGIVGGQLTYRYFPVREAELAADINYVELKEGRLDLGDGITLVTRYLNHPVLCLGYRIEFGGRVLCTAYDTEPYRNLFVTDPADPGYDAEMAREGEEVAADQNRLQQDFFAGADLLIHDSQYTEKEYRVGKLGWGHSSFEHAIAVARRAEVKRLALFHHDPERTDDQLDQLAADYCGGQEGPDIFMAREGMEVEI
ncbi:MBL fold metallo-hydrolase [Desulfurivibrio dismutans]|uniref:MBL fold metallo-hydrolase n=1 Tax=Desulfurivibrio dismutans TaxID=1398908 RepID=UPI0023DC11D4|nr:MBL fold metallo-hydrolase [Desulfurivibrio alkaliphilus]MDF1615710.1 MBL fold metallo-hydrolase [Desulfurivibrio alkaliphilus]